MSKAERLGFARIIAWGLLLVAVAIGLAGYTYREPIAGYAEVGTSYAARVGCSCRFVAGRSLGDCEKDKLAGMELVTLKDDIEAKSVTARFPLVTSATATYREGYGCVLEQWEG
ncbi:MAG: hypothetical protein V2J14_07105 [Erythrobacter sp.]|jgi:hypothetical protein|nr:hypothetical protein [Erythrobacter sp.]